MRVSGAVKWCVDRGVPGVVAASGMAMSVLIVGPLLLRRTPTHPFLVWNLALAWVPFIAAIGVDFFIRRRHYVATAVSAAIWIAFLPNAPYLVSDLTHYRSESVTPWLDLVRLVAFGWAGCLLVVASLRIVHLVVSQRAGVLVGWLVVAGAAIASGAGVVLGRFARLNSWELFTAPTSVAAESVGLAGSGRAVGVGVFFAVLVAVLYVSTTLAPRLRTA